MNKVISLGILVLLLIPLATALDFGDGVYLNPSHSNTTYQVQTTDTITNVSVNESHFGVDNRHVYLENGSALSVNLTGVSTRTSLSDTTLYTITYEIAGMTLFTTNVTFSEDFVNTAGQTINGVQFLANTFTFSGLLGTLRIFEAETFYFYFYDAVSGESITNVNVEVLSDEFSIITNTTDGNITLDLLPSPGEYNIRYSATGYDESFYYFAVDEATSNNISLYLYNSSDTDLISVLVKDTAADPVEGALVKVLRYETESNSYITVTSKSTNTEGYVVFYGTLNEEYYKFIVEYPAGTVKKITNPSYLFSTSLEIEIDLTEDILRDYFNINDIVGRVRWVDSSEAFSFFYTDPNNIVSQGCLKVYGLAGTREILVNSTCVSGDSNTISFAPNSSLYQSYRADAYVTYNSEDLFLESAYHDFVGESLDSPSNLVYVLLLTIVVCFIFLWSPSIAVSLLPTPALAMSFIGFIPVPWYYILPIQIMTIFGGFLLGKRG